MTKMNEILHGSALEKLKELESESVDCIITSPPININITNTAISGMSVEELAYMAGILDGEGSVMIRKSTYRMRNEKYGDCINPSYTPRVQIKMTDNKPLLLFKNTFGGYLSKAGKIYQGKDSFKTNKILYVYGAEHKIANTILTNLYPYLLVKKEQARLALEIYQLKQGHQRWVKGTRYSIPYPKEIFDKIQENWTKVKTLNGGVYFTECMN